MTVSVKKYDIPKQKLGATEAKSLAKEIEPIEEHACGGGGGEKWRWGDEDGGGASGVEPAPEHACRN